MADELRAWLFGLAIAASIGPIALLILDTGLRRGTRAAMACALGVASADFVYALAAFASGAMLSAALKEWQGTFRLVSSLLLIALGLWLARPAPRPEAAVSDAASARGPGFAGTFLLTLANPLTLLFFTAFSTQVTHESDPARVVWLSLWILLGSLPAQAMFALAGGALSRRVRDPRWARRLNLASAAAIILFGVAGVPSALSAIRGW